MTQRILIFGLPTSGKTTLATELSALLDTLRVELFNGDAVRTRFSDWNFSQEGRIRQATRMNELASNSQAQYVILDFVCPLEEMRRIVRPDWTIWVDTIDESKYSDTNKMFEEPNVYDFRVSTKDAQVNAQWIFEHIVHGKRRPVFNPQAPTVQMLGRWQPWHLGHQTLFEKAIAKTGQVAIMVRNCHDEKNPFDFGFVQRRIRRALDFKYQGMYTVIQVPNIVNITYGRDVGYTITQEDLGTEIHKISATAIRKEMGI